MNAAWPWWALGLGVIAALLYAANAYMDRTVDDQPLFLFDLCLYEDWEWAGIEDEWHQYLDSFPMTAEQS